MPLTTSETTADIDQAVSALAEHMHEEGVTSREDARYSEILRSSDQTLQRYSFAERQRIFLLLWQAMEPIAETEDESALEPVEMAV